MGRYISDELFHFVGFRHPTDHAKNYEVLRSVLSSGCIAHKPPYEGWGEDRVKIRWNLSLAAGHMIVPDMACFCDIPFEHLEIHTNKYGQFGLSLDKSYAIRKGARPVEYVPMHHDDHNGPYGRTLLNDIEAIYRGFRKVLYDNLPEYDRLPSAHFLGSEPTSHADAVITTDTAFLRHFLAFLKPYDADRPDGHKDHTYAEREWRRIGNMLFQPEHVKRVVVADGYAERIKADFPVYPGRVSVTGQAG